MDDDVDVVVDVEMTAMTDVDMETLVSAASGSGCGCGAVFFLGAGAFFFDSGGVGDALKLVRRRWRRPEVKLPDVRRAPEVLASTFFS